MNKTLNHNWFQIRAEIDNAPHSNKQAVARMWANRLNMSLDKLYRQMRKHLGKKKESSQPKQVNRDLVYMVMERKVISLRYGDGSRMITTERAIKQLMDMGIPGADQLVASTVDRIAREELGWNDRESYVRYECTHALQEVQGDFSFSKFFRVVGFDDSTGQWMLKATSTALDYKKDSKRQRILIGVLIDSYSRVRFHRALIGTGESAELCLEFLTHFFNRPKDGLVFRELAWQYRFDNGPLDSKLGKTFFDAIDRDYETTLPGEKTGLGKAERGWQEIWRWEQDLAMRVGDGNSIPLDFYNHLILQECINQQHLAHPYWKKEKRIDLYQQSVLCQEPRPETIDIDAKRIAFDVYERTVRPDQHVSINNEKYRVPIMAGEYRTTGRRIRILINKEGRMIGELLDRFAPRFEIQPFSHRNRGDFTGTPPRTTRQQLKKDLDSGRRFTADGDLPIHQGDDQPQRLMPKEKPAGINSPFVHVDPEIKIFSGKYQAMQYVSECLKKHGIEFTPDLVHHFEEVTINNALHKESIDTQINEFVTAWQETINQTGT